MFDVYEDIYVTRRNSPLWWHNKSADLKASAGVLWLAIDEGNNETYQSKLGFGRGYDFSVACWPVYQMAFGMSFELAIKSVLVAKNEQPPYTHDLIELAELSGIQFDECELNVFLLLTQSVVWDGRYPVPKKRQLLAKHYINSSNLLFEKEKFGDVGVEQYNHFLDWQKLDVVYQKISKAFFMYYENSQT